MPVSLNDADDLGNCMMDDLPEDIPNPSSSSLLRSESPPPPHALAAEEKRKAEAKALWTTWNGLAETLASVSISTPLEDKHDIERMRNMVAQLQMFISAWPEAIGAKEPGAAQRR